MCTRGKRMVDLTGCVICSSREAWWQNTVATAVTHARRVDYPAPEAHGAGFRRFSNLETHLTFPDHPLPPHPSNHPNTDSPSPDHQVVGRTGGLYRGFRSQRLAGFPAAAHRRDAYFGPERVFAESKRQNFGENRIPEPEREH